MTDAIADIIPNNLADIATVRVLVDGEEYIASGWGQASYDLFWPEAWKMEGITLL